MTTTDMVIDPQATPKVTVIEGLSLSRRKPEDPIVVPLPPQEEKPPPPGDNKSRRKRWLAIAVSCLVVAYLVWPVQFIYRLGSMPCDRSGLVVDHLTGGANFEGSPAQIAWMPRIWWYVNDDSLQGESCTVYFLPVGNPRRLFEPASRWTDVFMLGRGDLDGPLAQAWDLDASWQTSIRNFDLAKDALRYGFGSDRDIELPVYEDDEKRYVRFSRLRDTDEYDSKDTLRWLGVGDDPSMRAELRINGEQLSGTIQTPAGAWAILPIAQDRYALLKAKTSLLRIADDTHDSSEAAVSGAITNTTSTAVVAGAGESPRAIVVKLYESSSVERSTDAGAIEFVWQDAVGKIREDTELALAAVRAHPFDREALPLLQIENGGRLEIAAGPDVREILQRFEPSVTQPPGAANRPVSSTISVLLTDQELQECTAGKCRRVCGATELQPRISPEGSVAYFSVVNLPCALFRYTLAHELGHILGARHQSTPSVSSSDSYKRPLVTEGWGTLMAVDSCGGALDCRTPPLVRYPYFSNQRSSEFLPSGGQGSTADNARAVEEGWRFLARHGSNPLCRNVRSPLHSVLFEFDSTNYQAGQDGALKNAATLIQNCGFKVTLLEGHACDIGLDRRNKPLSRDRALRVQQALRELRVPFALRDPVDGRSSRYPAVRPTDPADEPARKRNRRVEIFVTGSRHSAVDNLDEGALAFDAADLPETVRLSMRTTVLRGDGSPFRPPALIQFKEAALLRLELSEMLENTQEIASETALKWLKQYDGVSKTALMVTVIPDPLTAELLANSADGTARMTQSMPVDLDDLRSYIAQPELPTRIDAPRRVFGHVDFPFKARDSLFSDFAKLFVLVSSVDGTALLRMQIKLCTPKTSCQGQPGPIYRDSDIPQFALSTQPRISSELMLVKMQPPKDGLEGAEYYVAYLNVPLPASVPSPPACSGLNLERGVAYWPMVLNAPLAQTGEKLLKDGAEEELLDVLFSQPSDATVQYSMCGKQLLHAAAGAWKNSRAAGLAPRLHVSVHDADDTLTTLLFPFQYVRVGPDGSQSSLGDLVTLVRRGPVSADAGLEPSCANQWTLVLADPKLDTDIRDVWSALQPAGPSAPGWVGPLRHLGTKATLEDWLNQDAGRIPTLLNVTAHHGDSDLELYKGGNRIFDSSLDKRFARPTVIVLNACGSGSFKAHALLRTLTRSGARALIVASKPISGHIAGNFDDCLTKAAKPGAAVSIGDLFEATRQCLTERAKTQSALADGPGVYSLIGDDSTLVCPPSAAEIKISGI